jgi:acetamidase/formamidase
MADHHLAVTPETVHWGYLDSALSPVLTVRSGDSVAIRAVNGGRGELPTDARFQVLDEHRAVVEHLSPQLGPHILTGPVVVETAEPGDVLEVQIEAVDFIQNWGWNAHKPLRGSLPWRFPNTRVVHILVDPVENKARCPWGSTVELRPFFGIMAVAPPPSYGRVSSIEPREYGGNIDNRELVAGARLFLPVFVPGALFSVGDGHGCQGDGEVNLTALETGLEGRFRLIVHKQRALVRPRAATPTHLITMAFDSDLDDAATTAVADMVDLLVACTGLDAADAYALCSLCCDLRITQIVDGNKGVHAMMPRHVLPSFSEDQLAGAFYEATSHA